MPSVILATRNQGKLREIRQVLSDLPVEVLAIDAWGALADIPEPRETGSTFADNARQKALYYARAAGTWCLADDSGLAVDALAGRPGVRSARYAADRCPPDAGKGDVDLANNRRLLEELAGLPPEGRTARFVCCLALADGKVVLVETAGVLQGRIAFAPAGSNGFGYDPIFIPDGAACSLAEMTPQQKNAISHRGQAVRLFAARLKDLLLGHSDQ